MCGWISVKLLITNIPVDGAGVTSDLTFDVENAHSIRGHAPMHGLGQRVSMPFNKFVLIVNGDVASKYYVFSNGWMEIFMGFRAGDNTLAFRVTAGEFGAEFHQYHHENLETGRVWLD